MKAVFDARGASTHQLKMLADWVRSISSDTKYGTFDVIKLIEVDLQAIFPDLGIFIEPDEEMGASRAFISDNPLGIVMSESIYEGACSRDLFSTEVILHEVGHLFLHRKYSSLALNSAPSYSSRIHAMNLANNAEWQANTFAMCLLYPFPDKANERTVDHVQERYGTTQKQAERVVRHFERLRTRDASRDLDRDRKWLRSVINALPRNEPKESLRAGDQLSLFYQSPSNLSLVA